MTARTTDSDERVRWPPAFHGRSWLPLVFVVAFSLWVMVSNVSFSWVFGSNPSVVAESLWNLPSGMVQFGLVLLVLRFEGVRLRDLGLGRRQLTMALVTVAGFVLAVNVAVAGLVVLGGGQLSVVPFGLYRSPPLEYSVPALVAAGVAQYVFVGPVEELAFRGYLQNKLTDLLGPRSARFRTAVAIVATAAVFAVLHVPTLVLVEGVPLGQAVGSLVMLTLSGIAFGTIYALTHNLFLVAFLHGIGNFWPLVVDPGVGAWPNWGLILILYGLVVVLYRQWNGGVFQSPERVGTEV
ncbi:type II CAAX prenyl endopeptidase Rce1 family protein [Halomarina salina]|uniref:Type II CAAX prenyl endopeptidase Rce1 family protein n=1 Tax=Halomarina salina TaxID=1872699 RepID=A0ABD5RUD2_9EURY|nr:CPBP family intramembrane glutamic endopeptidase [Halomarina salina]